MEPELKRVTYEAAISKAWEDILPCDFLEISRNSGVPFDIEDSKFNMAFLGEEYLISPLQKTVKTPEGQDVYSFLSVLLLHYLANARDLELTEKLLSFRELEGGDVYYSSEPETLRLTGEKIGAKAGDHGDVSIVLDAFPRIPITVILWEGDEEVPPSSNMLFDSSIKELLPTEDVAVIGGFVASYLVKNKPG
jgi:hypothetical protein